MLTVELSWFENLIYQSRNNSGKLEIRECLKTSHRNVFNRWLASWRIQLKKIFDKSLTKFIYGCIHDWVIIHETELENSGFTSEARENFLIRAFCTRHGLAGFFVRFNWVLHNVDKTLARWSSPRLYPQNSKSILEILHIRSFIAPYCGVTYR
jgi:hypothetical protein